MDSRRRFLSEMARLGVGAALAPLIGRLLDGPKAVAAEAGPHLAKYWHAEGRNVHCDLCPRSESLADGAWGFCHVRQNVGGKLITHGYDQPCILNIDPIEKNPLGHVLAGSEALAVAHAGCNLRCLYCQNWAYSQRSPLETRNIRDFDRSGALAKAKKRQLRAIVFTYTEATSSFEFTCEMAALAKSLGLVPTLCSCGFVQPKPFAELMQSFAAVTVTLKGPTEQFYDKVCQAKLKPVLETMALAKELKKWLEVATLVVPTLNDDVQSLRTMAGHIAKNLGPDTPWHLERFMPQYKLTNLPETPQKTLEMARQIGMDAGLKYVYISNLAPHEGNHTYCPSCHKAVIKRLGFKVLENTLRDGRCPSCRTAIAGLWA